MPDLADYQRLKLVAAAQLEAIEADDLERFGRLSDARDALMSRMMQPADLAERAVATRFLSEVAALDVKLQRALRASMDATQGELRQLRTGHRAVHAYAAPRDMRGVGGRA